MLDKKRVVCAPKDRNAADSLALDLGLPVQVSELVPPGHVYIFDPAAIAADFDALEVH